MSASESSSPSTWKSQQGFIWSLIGSAVGFANILSFSAHAYKNGGGVFLIPYFFALFLLGIPLLILEGTIGNRTKAPLVTAYAKVWGKPGKTLGWIAVFACLVIGGFYIVLTGYSVAYTYFSATNAIPADTKGFFLDSFLHLTPSLYDFGSLSKPILLSTIGVAVATWYVLVRNVRDGIERVCTIFMPLLAVLITSFALITLFLPGGASGWYYYLRPDFSKILDPLLWRDIFGQLFFSLSLGLGIVIGYSRHTEQKTDVVKSMIYVALGDFAVSFISGAAIFGCLAHMSYVQQIPFDSILTSVSPFEIGFVIFPKILQSFGPLLSQVVGVLFFACIFIAGITGVFSIVESIAGNVQEEFRWSRKKAVTATILALVVLALPFCMGNANHIIDAVAPMVMGTNMLIGGSALIIAFQFFCKETKNDPIWKKGDRLNLFAKSLRYVAPFALLVILLGNLAQEFASVDIGTAIRWGWFALALSLAASFAFLTERRPQNVPAFQE